ncbi:uncharacterized protein RDI95_012766 isoform 2-T5 [Morus bassanus]
MIHNPHHELNSCRNSEAHLEPGIGRIPQGVSSLSTEQCHEVMRRTHPAGSGPEVFSIRNRHSSCKAQAKQWMHKATEKPLAMRSISVENRGC